MAMNLDRPVSPAPATASIVALPPRVGAGENAVARTVITLILSGDCNVAITFPAWVRRVKVSGESTLTISDIWATSRRAAARGSALFVTLVAGAMMWL